MLSSLGVRVKTAFIILLTVAITAIFVLYTKETSLSLATIETIWTDYHQSSVANTESLIRLQSHTGYGGFFHSLKRYAATHDPDLLHKLSQQSKQLESAIENYQALSLSPQEHTALSTLSTSLTYYTQQIEQHKTNSAPIILENDVDNIAALGLLTQTARIRNQTNQIQASNALNQALSIMLWANLLIPAAIILGTASIAFMLQTLAAKKRAENNKQNLVSLIEASPDAMITVSTNGVITQCNHQTEHLFDAPREQLINKNIQSLIELNLNLSETNNTTSYRQPLQETFAILHDERQIPVEIGISLAQLDTHNTFIITLRDITVRKNIEFTLMHNESRLRSILESVGEGVIGVNKVGICTFVNPAALKILDLPPETNLVGENLHSTLHHIQHDHIECDLNNCALNKAILEGQPFHSDHEILKDANQHYFDAELRSYPLIENNNVTGAVITFCDISERKEHEAHLKQAAIVFNGTKDGIIISDHNANIVAVNQAFCELSGYTEEEALNQHIHFHKYDDFKNTPNKKINHSLQSNGHWQGETWNRRKDNEIYPVWEDISRVENNQRQITHYISVFSDISAIKESEQRLNHLAHHDILTGLPNRLLFSVNLTQTLERAKRHKYLVGLLFIDLDRFKIINDTLGHAAGDHLLEKIAERLKQSVRAEDTVARLGGDEFTIILSQIHHPEDAAILAKKIIETLSQAMEVNQQEVVTSASIGISIFPDDAQTGEDLAKAADAAMYRAKDSGRGTYKFYSTDLTTRAMEHLELERDLRQAIQKKEFVLHYQPQYSLRTNQLVGVEALLRWQHPTHGLILPDKFINFAEETGQIKAITEWVLSTVIHQIQHWLQLGLPAFRVSVNISGREVMNNDILVKLKNVIEHSNIDVDAFHLELEITESVLQNATQSAQILKELKTLGVSLAIDDFGTGYSSLSRLKHFPIDTLKIDRSFVKDLPLNQDDGAIASAVIALGQSLNLRVIAEGTETKEQIRFLRDLGCDEVQGFVLSKPLPAEHIPQLVHTPPSTLTLH